VTQQEHVRGQRTVYGKDAEVANEQPDVARVCIIYVHPSVSSPVGHYSIILNLAT